MNKAFWYAFAEYVKLRPNDLEDLCQHARSFIQRDELPRRQSKPRRNSFSAQQVSFLSAVTFVHRLILFGGQAALMDQKMTRLLQPVDPDLYENPQPLVQIGGTVADRDPGFVTDKEIADNTKAAPEVALAHGLRKLITTGIFVDAASLGAREFANIEAKIEAARSSLSAPGLYESEFYDCLDNLEGAWRRFHTVPQADRLPAPQTATVCALVEELHGGKEFPRGLRQYLSSLTMAGSVSPFAEPLPPRRRRPSPPKPKRSF